MTTEFMAHTFASESEYKAFRYEVILDVEQFGTSGQGLLTIGMMLLQTTKTRVTLTF